MLFVLCSRAHLRTGYSAAGNSRARLPGTRGPAACNPNPDSVDADRSSELQRIALTLVDNAHDVPLLVSCLPSSTMLSSSSTGASSTTAVANAVRPASSFSWS